MIASRSLNARLKRLESVVAQATEPSVAQQIRLAWEDGTAFDMTDQTPSRQHSLTLAESIRLRHRRLDR